MNRALENAVYDGVLDVEEFMEYMREEFPEPMKYHFTYDMLQGIVNYLMEQEFSIVQMANILIEIVPELEVEEILRFSKKRK